MLLAYKLSLQFNDSAMLGEGTYRPLIRDRFHDWRYRIDGVPHPATCPTCGSKINDEYFDREFKVTHRRYDLSLTYDGYLIASTRFASYCLDQRLEGVSFNPLPADRGFLWMKLSNRVGFDTERRKTRFEEFCSTCNGHYTVVGATPVFLLGVLAPLPEGFHRTDIEFGSGPEKSPIALTGIQTGKGLQQHGFKGVHLVEVFS